MLSTPLAAIPYLFTLPVIITSVLMKPRSVFIVASGTSILILSIDFVRQNSISIEMFLPLLIIVSATLVGWLSTCNLYAVLAWVWRGYEEARRNEQMVREQQGELRRVLKALDETTNRLERTNYMLTLARDQAEEARRLKQQFVQTISHELRTPLNLIVSFTELMI